MSNTGSIDFGLLINDIFWVGSLGGFERSSRLHVLYFQSLSKYFYNIFDFSSEDQEDIVSCYCESSQQTVSIPAKVVCFSRASLLEWVVGAGFEFPAFVLSGNLITTVGNVNKDGGFNQKELGTISKVMSGLVDIIKAVDKAHRESPTDYHGKKRAENIKRYADMFSNPPRANFDMYSALISLAEEVGIDMPTDHQTLRKYMGAHPKAQ